MDSSPTIDRAALSRPARQADEATGITLCALAKDEERNLAVAIQSVRAGCDEVVVGLDDRSGDRTVDVAKANASRVLRIPFSSFPASRNMVLDAVRTPWVLFLDADEAFEPHQASSLAALTKHAPPDVWGFEVTRHNLFSNGGWFTDRRVRLFRADPRIRFEGAISEDVTNTILRHGGRVNRAPTFFNHFGPSRPFGERRAKYARYVELAVQYLSSHPADSYRRGRLAFYLTSLGHLQSASEESLQAIAHSPEIPELHFIRGTVLRALGNLPDSLSHYKEAASQRPDDGVYWNMIGVLEIMLSRLPDAEQSFLRARRVEPSLASTPINQGLLAEGQRRPARAREFFEESAAMNSAFLLQDWEGRLEFDPWRPMLCQTIPGYAGLKYHLAACSK